MQFICRGGLLRLTIQDLAIGEFKEKEIYESIV